MQNNYQKTLTNFAMTLLVAAQANATINYPGDLCCTLYDNYNYEGAAFSVCYDAYRQGSQDYWLDPTYHVKSWWCGKNISYDFCEDNSGSRCQSGAGAIQAPAMQAPNQVAKVTLA